MKNIIAQYRNGNYNVIIMEDGTKIRYNNEDKLIPSMPESMDLKITNQCDMGCPMCFVEDTKILMADYSYKNIQDIKIGDEVIGFISSSNTSHLEFVRTKVLKLFKHFEEELIKTKTENGNVIISTKNHPFLSKINKTGILNYNPIKDLGVGSYLFVHCPEIYYVNSNPFTYKKRIISQELVNSRGYVYNFETDCHTYIANNFLVHNCHEGSTVNGLHGDILNTEFLKTMHPYTEIAIGGGNPLQHPDLVKFLENMKEQKMIPSMTVHQKHFMENLKFIHWLLDNKLIYGLGISLTSPDENFIKEVKKIPNAVIHVINGLVPMSNLEALANNNLKILVLGYKTFRRGKTLYETSNKYILSKSRSFKFALPKILEEKWFDVVSFDNLAIKQLDVHKCMDEERWNNFYMGDDGSYTMFVDLVNNTYSTSSTTPVEKRHPIGNSLNEMFAVIRKENNNG